MTETLIDLTAELLSCGVFNHLPDGEIARLSMMVLQGRRDGKIPARPLLNFWYRGDYYSSNCSPYLLQQCNECLQRIGQPMIDVYGEEFYEA